MNSLIALFLALGVYALLVQSDFLSGFCVAVPSAVVKFLALIFAPGYFFASRRKLSLSLSHPAPRVSSW